MGQKSFRGFKKITVRDIYVDKIIPDILELKPELVNPSKTTEFALQLLYMQAKGEIIRTYHRGIDELIREYLERRKKPEKG